MSLAKCYIYIMISLACDLNFSIWIWISPFLIQGRGVMLIQWPDFISIRARVLTGNVLSVGSTGTHAGLLHQALQSQEAAFLSEDDLYISSSSQLSKKIYFHKNILA